MRTRRTSSRDEMEVVVEDVCRRRESSARGEGVELASASRVSFCAPRCRYDERSSRDRRPT